MIARRALAVGLLLALSPVARAAPGGEAQGFAAEGVWMYEPKDGETVNLTVAVDKPLRLFFKGYIVVTEVRRSQEFQLLFAVNMVEIRSFNRRLGSASMTVKGDDGRQFTVLVTPVDLKKGPASPEIVTVR